MNRIKNFILSKSSAENTSLNITFIKNTLGNSIAKVVTICINLLMIPLLLNILGNERFGIWQTILSFITWGSLLNLGLGNGLRNLITQLYSKNDIFNISISIGKTIKITSFIALIASLIIIPSIFYFFNPDILFEKNSVDKMEIIYAFVIFIFFFLVNIILGLSNSISYGFQQSSIVGIFNAGYLILCYLALVFLNKLTIVNLELVAIIFGLSQSLLLIFLFHYLSKKYKFKINIRGNFSLSSTYKLSGKFFILQLLSIAYMSVDYIVISMLLGAEETTEFSIVNRIFFTLISIFSILLIQFWNSVTEANENKNLLWIKRTIKHLALGAGIILILGVVLSIFNSQILDLWLGENAPKIALSTFFLFTGYTFLHCLNAIFINYFNGIGQLKYQMILMFISILIYILGCISFNIQVLGYNVLIIFKIMGISTYLIGNILLIRKTLYGNIG